MTLTLAATLAAHNAGKSPAETIEETYARIAAHADPALFIALRPEAEALAEAGACRRSALGAGRSLASPSRSRTISTSPGCRRPPLVPAFAYRQCVRLSSCKGSSTPGRSSIGKTNLDQFATGLVGVRSPYGVPRNALRADLIPGGSSSGSATSVGAGLGAVRARHRHRGFGSRAGGAQRDRRPEAEPRRAFGWRRRAGLPDARHDFDLRARRRRRLRRVARRRGLRRSRPLFAPFPCARARRIPAAARRRPRNRWSFSATQRPKPPSRAMSPPSPRWASEIVEFDFSAVRRGRAAALRRPLGRRALRRRQAADRDATRRLCIR